MANYDGSITYFNIGYEKIDNLYMLDSYSLNTIVDNCGDDWFVAELENVQYYHEGRKRVFSNPVQFLGLKTQNYGVLLFEEENEDESRDVFINLINVNTGECLDFCPVLRENVTDLYIFGVANTTPNTKVFVLGYDYKFIAFYSTLMTKLSNMQDYQCICTDAIATYAGQAEDYDINYSIASMNGEFYGTEGTKKYVKAVISTSIPFRALVLYTMTLGNEAFASVGDVFTSLQDLNSVQGKITYNNVDYCRYTKVNNESSLLWFRCYGGSNGV